MNNKGFTLIELLVSLVLLVIITTSVVISVRSSFDSVSEDTYDDFIEQIETGACTYAENNDLRSKCADKSNCSLSATIDEVIKEGYIDQNLINPKTKEVLDTTDRILIEWNEGQKTCEYNG